MPEIYRFIIFASIGAFNTFLDVYIWQHICKVLNRNGVKLKFGKYLISNYVIAHCFSFFVGACSSYILNSFLTFSDKTGGRLNSKQFVSFFTVTITTFLITTLILNLLTNKKCIDIGTKCLIGIEKALRLKNGVLSTKWLILAKIATVGIGTFSNFFGYRLLVF